MFDVHLSSCRSITLTSSSTDLESMTAFYSDVLGLKVTKRATITGEWISRVVGLTDAHADVVYLDFPAGPRVELIKLQPPGIAASAQHRPAERPRPSPSRLQSRRHRRRRGTPAHRGRETFQRRADGPGRTGHLRRRHQETAGLFSGSGREFAGAVRVQTGVTLLPLPGTAG